MYLGTTAPDAAPCELSTMDGRSTVASMAAGGVRSAAPDVLNLEDGRFDKDEVPSTGGDREMYGVDGQYVEHSDRPHPPARDGLVDNARTAALVRGYIGAGTGGERRGTVGTSVQRGAHQQPVGGVTGLDEAEWGPIRLRALLYIHQRNVPVVSETDAGTVGPGRSGTVRAGRGPCGRRSGGDLATSW
jgi:hypothetical protein